MLAIRFYLGHSEILYGFYSRTYIFTITWMSSLRMEFVIRHYFIINRIMQTVFIGVEKIGLHFGTNKQFISLVCRPVVEQIGCVYFAWIGGCLLIVCSECRMAVKFGQILTCRVVSSPFRVSLVVLKDRNRFMKVSAAGS